MARPLARGHRGFTMVELMITLVVVAILAVAAAPSFTDFMDRYRLRGATDDVISVIANARASAVKTNRDVAIAFGGTTASWCMGANEAVDPAAGQPYQTAVACNCVTTTACQVEGQRLAVDQGKHRDVAISSVAPNYIINSRLGTAVAAGAIATPAQVTFTSPSGKYDALLQVSALGQARICIPVGKPNIAGIPSC